MLKGNRNRPRTPKPYIWVSWITGLLAGTSKCQWSAWFKAHYHYAKRPEENTGNLAQWNRDHREMVDARVNLMRADGWEVRVETDNAFKIEGRTATLAAKPDIVGVRGIEARVIDEKSGQPRDSDPWQVKVYMWGLPLVSPFKAIDGEVQYRGHIVEIKAAELTEDAVKSITGTLSLVGGPEEPPRTPSLDECRFCNIADCPDRMNPPPESTAASLDF